MVFLAAIPAVAYAQSCTAASNPIVCSPSNGSFTVVFPTTNGGGNSAASTVTVPAVSGTIQSISVTLNKYSSDEPQGTAMALKSPTGEVFGLFWVVCNDGSSASNATLTLLDSAANRLPTDTQNCSGITTGSFKPSTFRNDIAMTMPSPGPGTIGLTQRAGTAGSATFASSFTANPSGVWTLYLYHIYVGNPVPGFITHQDTLGDASTPAWSLSITMNAAASPTTTSVSASPNPATAGSNTNITATVSSTAGTPTGTVTFTDNGVNISGCVGLALSSGSRVCTTAITPQGVHIIAANYAPSGNFGSSNGSLNLPVYNSTTNPTSGTYCNTGAIPVPRTGFTGAAAGAPGDPYPAPITVSGLAGVIQNISVSLLNLNLQYPQAVGLMLVGPNGNNLDMFSWAGGSSAITGVNLTLADSGANSIPQNSAPVTGSTYKPTSYASAFGTNYCSQSGDCPSFPVASYAPSSFNSALPKGTSGLLDQFAGGGPNGTWKLYAVNRLAGANQTGTITGGWCVNITTQTGAHPTTTALTSSTNPSLAGNNVTFTATVTDQTTPATPVNTGTVTFTDGVTTLGTVSVVNGVATQGTSALTEGGHNI